MDRDVNVPGADMKGSNFQIFIFYKSYTLTKNNVLLSYEYLF